MSDVSWRCPVCQIPIKHEKEMLPVRPESVYRCHVCRLEFVLDSKTLRMVLAPLTPPQKR